MTMICVQWQKYIKPHLSSPKGEGNGEDWSEYILWNGQQIIYETSVE